LHALRQGALADFWHQFLNYCWFGLPDYFPVLLFGQQGAMTFWANTLFALAQESI